MSPERAKVMLRAMVQQGRLKMHRPGCGYWEHVACWGSIQRVDEVQEAKGEEARTCEIRELRAWAES